MKNIFFTDTLGLKRGTVKLTEYSEHWKICFELEKKLILKAAGNIILDIQHIGSTSVPGIKAKPIVDMGITVETEDNIEKLAQKLEKLDYSYFGDREDKGDFFFAKGSDKNRTHYLHVSVSTSGRLERDVKFRNALRSNVSLRKQYELLKENLCEIYGNNRKRYTEGKDVFIQSVIEEIMQFEQVWNDATVWIP